MSNYHSFIILFQIGGETCTRLTKIDKEKEYSCLKPLPGHFVSSAGGILVALLDATEQLIYNGKRFVQQFVAEILGGKVETARFILKIESDSPI